MASAGEQGRSTGSSSSAAMLLEGMKLLGESQGKPGPKKTMNSELWHACAGPLVSLPQPGSLVYYFPQGHSEQVTASTRKSANVHIPNYPSLPSQMMCQVHSVTLHADRDSDEIYAQMTLQPVISELDVFPIPDLGHTRSKHPNEFFCKTLTASDTSTHGGFSVPRRAAEKLFPQLDYSMQPPNQELIVRDLHDNLWTFRHIYRGQPKRHLLTTGWSSFVGAKRLKAGDSVLFIRDAKSQLLLGVRRTNRQQTTMPSSVLSTDSMHIGVLAAAAHAAASRSPFTVYYNPRACPSEFVIPLAKYHKAAYTQVSIGMRFGMMFETEESTKRRYMGTILGISNYDPLRWPNSKWRNLQVEWDEHGYGERPDRVSVWEIETPESLFVFPTSTSLKRQCLPGFVVPSMEIGFANTKTLLHSPENGNADLNPIISGFDSGQLKKMLLEPQITFPNRHVACHSSIYASIFHSIRSNNMSGTFPSVQAITGTPRSSLLPEGEVDNTVFQQKHQFPLASMLPSQGTLSQNKSCQHHVDHQVVDLASDSCTPREQHEQLVGESLPDQKLQDQNSHSVQKNIKQNISETQLIHGTISEKSATAPALAANQVDGHSQNSIETSCQQLSTEVEAQVSKEMNGENSLGSANTENVASYKDHTLQIKEQSASLLLDQQLEVNISHSPRLETIQSSDTPDNIMQHDELHSNQCFDQEGWMLNSTSHHSSSGSLETSGPLLGSCKPDPLLLSVSDDSTNSSGDISNIMNQENMNAGNMFQFSRNSDLEASQCLPTLVQEYFGTQELNLSHEERVASGIMSSMHDLAFQEEDSVLHFMSNMSGVKDFPNDTNHQNEICNTLNFEASNGSMILDPCFPNTVLESFGTLKGPGVHIPSEFCFGNSSSNQDVQSQVTSASLIDSQVFSLQDIPDSSGGTSSGSIDANEYNILNKGPKKQVSPQPLRTYTKVQKLGSVGRSIDVTRFRNYHELKSAIACMFGLEGQLDDPNGSEWKLVYVDYENDVLLVGDDPWEEFVNCVRCIRILSPSEVQQMSEEGMQFINSSAVFHHVNKSSCLDNNSHEARKFMVKHP